MAYAFSGKWDRLKNTERTSILGITFLRHTFVLYDIPQAEVAIAPIHRAAIETMGADQVTFVDGYVHQGQPGYNPSPAQAPSCIRVADGSI